MSELVQNGLVGLIVLWSVWVTLSRLAPNLGQQRLATWLNNKGWTTAGRYFSSPQKKAGCDSGCGSCASVCSNPVEQVVKFVHK